MMKELTEQQKKEIEQFKNKILWNRDGNLNYEKAIRIRS